MRRSSMLKGLKSKFTRAVRKVKAFFGWREHGEETTRETEEQTAFLLQARETDSDTSSDDGGDSGDGGGESGGDPPPSLGRVPKESDAVGGKGEPEPEPKFEGSEQIQLTNYAIPPGMADDEYRKLLEERRRREAKARRRRERLRAQRERERAELMKKRRMAERQDERIAVEKPFDDLGFGTQQHRKGSGEFTPSL